MSRFFVAFGPHRARPLPGEVLLCALDAAHLRSVFLGRVWVMTHLDANKELTILALCGSPAEDADHAAWFIKHCRLAYPALAAIVHDQGTALLNSTVTAALREPLAGRGVAGAGIGYAESSVVMSALCARHYEKHLVARHRDVKNVSSILYKLAHARTEDVVNSVLEEAVRLRLTFMRSSTPTRRHWLFSTAFALGSCPAVPLRTTMLSQCLARCWGRENTAPFH